MKITAITVTDVHGTDHRWEGVEGYLHTGMEDRKSEQEGARYVPYGRTVTAHLLLPLEPRPEPRTPPRPGTSTLPAEEARRIVEEAAGAKIEPAGQDDLAGQALAELHP